MKPLTGPQAARLGAIALLLLAAALLGLVEGGDGFSEAETDGQRLAAGCQIGYGIFAVAALAALRLRARWFVPAVVAWGVCFTATAGLATVHWGDAPLSAGLLASGATLVVAGLVCWGAIAHRRLTD